MGFWGPREAKKEIVITGGVIDPDYQDKLNCISTMEAGKLCLECRRTIGAYVYIIIFKL